MDVQMVEKEQELSPQEAQKLFERMDRHKARRSFKEMLIRDYIKPAWARQDKPTQYCVVAVAVALGLLLALVPISFILNIIS